MVQINAYSDGDKVSKELEEFYAIRDLNLQITQQDELKLSFVGLIIKENQNPLVVFPKKYKYNTQKIVNEVQLLLKVLEKSQDGLSKTDNMDSNVRSYNFPLQSYAEVCSYYRKYGLYNEERKTIRQGYKGRVNWQYTVNKSPKLLNEGNVIFMPFYIEKKEHVNVFISKCMEEVLAHGYLVFGQLFNYGVKYFKKERSLSKFQIENRISNLRKIQFNYFKDNTTMLIKSLISYFEWRSNNYGKDIRLITKHFETIWENMVHNFLTNNDLDVDTGVKPHTIKLSQNGYQNNEVFQKQTEIVKQNKNAERIFRVNYDHIKISHSKREIVLFDSKYFKGISGLEYKQVVYGYFLLSKFEGYQIINGLILPTNGEYYSKTHISREGIDNIFITEHYLNLKEVMMLYVRTT